MRFFWLSFPFFSFILNLCEEDEEPFCFSRDTSWAAPINAGGFLGSKSFLIMPHSKHTCGEFPQGYPGTGFSAVVVLLVIVRQTPLMVVHLGEASLSKTPKPTGSWLSSVAASVALLLDLTRGEAGSPGGFSALLRSQLQWRHCHWPSRFVLTSQNRVPVSGASSSCG